MERFSKDATGWAWWMLLIIPCFHPYAIRFTNARGFSFRTRDTHSTKHSKVLPADTSPTSYQKHRASFKSPEVLSSNVCHWWCRKLLCCKAAPGLIASIQKFTQLSLADSHDHSLPLALQGFCPWQLLHREPERGNHSAETWKSKHLLGKIKAATSIRASGEQN